MQESPPAEQGPLFLIDESLADTTIAHALVSVGYNAVAVKEEFGENIEDPTLIQWLGFRGGVWVTADEEAKWKHSEAIKKAGIHILWVKSLLHKSLL